jgi:hypothetical protein
MFTSWKTSLLGIGLGFLNLVVNGMTAKQAGMSLGLAALGCLAKDHNVTGGTVSQ